MILPLENDQKYMSEKCMLCEIHVCGEIAWLVFQGELKGREIIKNGDI